MPLTRNRVQNKSFYCMFLSHGLKKFVKARKSPEKDYCQGDVSARSHWLMVSGASCVKGVMEATLPRMLYGPHNAEVNLKTQLFCMHQASNSEAMNGPPSFNRYLVLINISVVSKSSDEISMPYTHTH